MLADILPNDYKIVRDSVHGYIRIPTCYMREIVDTELFQRLRHIEQTSMRPLFPSSRHDRFIHSLGVYHLGCRAFESVFRNASTDGVCKELEDSEVWWSKHYVLFTLACLLHDCAHAAFSHTYEDYYTLPKKECGATAEASSTLNLLDAEMLVEYEADESFADDFCGKSSSGVGNSSGVGAPHERMSALMVHRYFKDGIERVFTCINEYRNANDLDEIILEDTDYAFMARMIIGCQYTTRTDLKSQLRNCFVSLLNSQTFDVDGLDYMIRDTYNSGITNRTVDSDRLLDSLCLREAVHFSGTRVEDLSIEGVWLPNATIWLDSYHQQNADAVLIGDLNCKFDYRDDWRSFLQSKGLDNHGDLFFYQTSGDLERAWIRDMRDGCEIHVNKLCRAHLKHWTGKLKGVLCAPAAELKSVQQTADCFTTYVLAYGKSSLSVLQSAVDARNTFYQWVYTHPQVVYHSSFLQNYLLKMSAKYLCCLQRVADMASIAGASSPGMLEQEMPPRRCLLGCPLREGGECESCGVKPVGEEDAIARILGIEGFFNPNGENSQGVVEWLGHRFWRSSDDDLNSLFKWVYLHNKERGDARNKDIEEYFGEYFSRPHHRAIWKSYGELALLKRKHPSIVVPEFSDLRGAEQSMTSRNYVFVDKDNKSFVPLFTTGVRELIAIESKAKLKSLDYAGILVAYGEDTERLVDVLDSSTSFTSPEPLMFVFREKD